MTQITKVIGRVQLRGGTTAIANTKNEVLLDRELFIEKNKGIKVGDGVTPYRGLDYAVDFTQTSLPEGGGNIGGTNYVFVKGDGTPTENYAELIDAYETAKEMSPSKNNVITVVISPGIYEGANINFDTDYIDITSLTGQPDVIIPSRLTFSQSKVTGIKSTIDNSFTSTNSTFINCVGGDFSFRSYASYLTTKCYNCVGGNDSFYHSNHYSALHCYDCVSKNDSFKMASGEAQGYFHRCTGRDRCFKIRVGPGSITCYNCIGGEASFFIPTGFAYNCHGGADSLLTSDNSVFSTINRIPV